MTTDHLNEWWDLYNLEGQIIGQQQRKTTVPNGNYHLVVNVFIFDMDKRVLLQRRSMRKLNQPGVWDCSAGGSVLRGENAQQGIMRETREELGVDLQPADVDEITRFRGKDWLEVWFATQFAFNSEDLMLQTDEVAQVQMMSSEKAQQLLSADGVRPLTREFKVALNWLNNK